jgi:Fe2+ or Zn2+ uptake regulation protein
MKQAFSPLRQTILGIVETSCSPLSAHDIFKSIQGTTAFSTVYRALWYLEEQEKIEGFFVSCSQCGRERYYTRRSSGHVHFFHCEICHSFSPVAECLLDPLKKSIEKKHGFIIRHHSIQLSGVCSGCRGAGHG